MFILQTLKEFIDNPMGKGSNAIPNRQLIKDDLNRRYEQLVRKKKINVDIYKDSDEYYFHFKIPSESERNNSYDVVLHFTMDKDDFRSDKNLDRYYVKFFSNSPSFTYTYGFVFNLYGLLVEDLMSKYDDRVLNEDPSTRNPGEIISYEKSIYFACYHLMQNRHYMNKIILQTLAKPYTKRIILANVRTDEQIQMEIKKENNRIKEEKEKEKRKEQKHASKKERRTQPKGDSIRIIDAKKSSVNKISPKKKIGKKK